MGSSRTAITEHSGGGCSCLCYMLGCLHYSEPPAPDGSCVASLAPQKHSALTDPSLVHSLLNLLLGRCLQLPRVPSRSRCCPGRTVEGPSPGLTSPATKHNCLKSGCHHSQTHFTLQLAKLRTLALHPPSCGPRDKSPPLSAAGRHHLRDWQRATRSLSALAASPSDAGGTDRKGVFLL